MLQNGQFQLCLLKDKISAAYAGRGMKCSFMNLASLEWLETQMHPAPAQPCMSLWPLKIFNFILNHNIYPPQHLVNLCTVDSGCLTISLGG